MHLYIEEVKNIANESSAQKRYSRLNDVILHIQSAFRKEEERLIEVNFPDLEIHSASHIEFARAVGAFIFEHEEEQSISKQRTNEICDYILEWIEYHKQKYDEFAQSFERLARISI